MRGVLLGFITGLVLVLLFSLFLAAPARAASTGLTDCSNADNSTATSGTWNGGGDTAGEWLAVDNSCVDNGSEASITDNNFDQESSYVLYSKNYGFSVSGTITGIKVKVNGYSSNGTGTLDLIQLLDTGGTRGGTNAAAADPQAMSSDSAWTYSWGGDGEMWGLSLTDTWVNDADFGVALGLTSGNNNQDHYVDAVQIDVFYSTGGGGGATRRRMIFQ